MTKSKCEKVVKHNSFLKAKTPSPSQISFVTLREQKKLEIPLMPLFYASQGNVHWTKYRKSKAFSLLGVEYIKEDNK